MSEYFNEVPSEEERNFKYRGIGLEEFRKLSDEEAADIVRLHDENRLAVIKNGTDDEYWEMYDTAMKFYNFLKWRKYGVPDRPVDEDEVGGHVMALIERRGHIDMETGGMKEADTIVGGLTQVERATIKNIINNLYLDEAGFQRQPYIYGEDCDFECMPRQKLLDLGVIESYVEPGDRHWQPETRYYLKQPFLDYLLYSNTKSWTGDPVEE
jgi:hypothetical protein